MARTLERSCRQSGSETPSDARQDEVRSSVPLWGRSDWLTIPVEGSEMKRVNQFTFVRLGQALSGLRLVKGGQKISDQFGHVLPAREQLKTLLSDPSLQFVTCRSAIDKLLAAIDGVTPKIFLDPHAAGSKTVDDIQKELDKPLAAGAVSRMLSALQTFEIVLAAELETMNTYVVSKKGIYSTSELIDRADEAFTVPIRSALSPEAIENIRQSGRCLAFDSYTASGFHMIRAAETVIFDYYKRVTQQTPKRKDRNWGAYVSNLRAHNKKSPQLAADEKLIALIDQVREHHRNPVMHPEVTLNEDEALSLFNICQSIIIASVGAIKALEEAQLMLVPTPAENVHSS